MDILPVSGWQVIQEEKDRIKVLLCGIKEIMETNLLASRLDSDLKREGADVSVVVQVVDEIHRSPSGKTPLIRALKK